MVPDHDNSRDRPALVILLLLAIPGGPALGVVFSAVLGSPLGPVNLVAPTVLTALWIALVLVPIRLLWSDRAALQRRVTEVEGALHDQRAAEGQLRHDAMHDTLTELPNRALVLDRIAQCIARAKREDNYCFAVLYLDLDDFKIVNDSLGHRAGDELLVQIAHRLVACLRALDSVSRPTANTTARLGGDEFVVLLDGLRSPEDAVTVAERMARAVAEPMWVQDHEIVTTLSIGIAANHEAYERPDEILRDADTALYEAKDQGKGRHAIFDAVMRASAVRKLEVKSELRRAIGTDELEVRYQPIVSLADESILGFEALLRWNHPQRGMLNAAEFVPVAESLGLTVTLGNWVTRQACRQVETWRRRSEHLARLFLCINISCKQFYDEALFANIDEVLAETGFDASLLMLEVTEAVIMERPGHTRTVIDALKKRRLGLHMDDFGTGYSSLSHLHQLPISAVKLDRTYVHEIDDDAYAATAKAVVTLAHSRHMKVIAEGIETPAQAALLTQLGCDLGQGFYYASPLPADAITALLQRGGSWRQSA